jgi:hypothetical protein
MSYTTYTESTYQQLLDNNLGNFYAQIGSDDTNSVKAYVIDFTDFIDNYNTNSGNPVITQQDVSFILQSPDITEWIDKAGDLLNPAGTGNYINIGEALVPILQNSPDDQIELVWPSILAVPPAANNTGDHLIGLYSPVNTMTDADVRAFIDSQNDRVFILPSFDDGVYYDVSSYIETVPVFPALTGVGIYDMYNLLLPAPTSLNANSGYYNRIPEGTTADTHDIIQYVQDQYALGQSRIRVFSNIGYDLYNRAGFDALLASAGANTFYGAYNNTIYDFTDFYDDLVTNAAVTTPPGTDVTYYNGADDNAIAVADGIVARRNVLDRGNTEENIFDILVEVTASFGVWGILRVGRYDPDDNIMTNESARALLNPGAGELPWIVRYQDIFYDITFGTNSYKNLNVLPGNPPYFTDTYPDTVEGIGAGIPTDSGPLFTRSLERDAQNYADVFLFLEDVRAEYANGAPDVTRIGYAQEWSTQGTELPPGFSNAQVGYAVDMSRDGTTIAFAENSLAGNDASPLIITVYRFISGAWSQIGGMDINLVRGGTATPRQRFISLSANGNTIAVGDNAFGGAGQGRAFVYTLDVGSGFWTMKGTPIVRNITNELFGSAVALSGNGDVLVVADSNITTNMINARAYRFDGTDWIPVINFTEPNNLRSDTVGLMLASSYDGDTIAVGDGRNGAAGRVRVYDYNGTDDYTQVGPDIASAVANPTNFSKSIDISADGRTLIAGVTAQTENKGAAEVFVGPGWTPLGRPIYADDQLDTNYGASVSMSSDGSRVAIGSIDGSIDPPGSTGYVRVKEYNMTPQTWEPIGRVFRLEGPDNGDEAFLNRITGPGDRVVLGAPGGSHVRVVGLNATPHAFDNYYDQVLSNFVFPNNNIITDLDPAGTDNDPESQPLTIDQTDLLNPGFDPFGSLPNNPFFGVPGDPRAPFTKQVTLDGYFLYLSANGAIRYERDTADPIPLIAPSFKYTVTDGVTSSPVSMAATVTFNLVLKPLSLSPDPPPTITAQVSASSPSTPVITDGTGDIAVDGGIGPYTDTIMPVSTPRGQITLSTLDGFTFSYDYMTDPAFDTLGSYTDIYTFEITDGDFATVSTIITVQTTIADALVVDSLPQAVVSREVGQPYVEMNLDGIISVSGGIPPYFFGVVGGTVDEMNDVFLLKDGDFGTMKVNTDTGEYEYISTNIPINPISTMDSFVLTVSDQINQTEQIPFEVVISVYETGAGYELLPIPDGLVAKSIGGTNTVFMGVSGTVMAQPGTGVPALGSFGVQNPDSTIGDDQIKFGQYGQFVIDTQDGSFNYIPDTLVGSDPFQEVDSFVITSVSTEGDQASTPYNVSIEVRPDMLLGDLTPSAGSICRNSNNVPGAFESIGLSGVITPAANYTIGDLSFSIDGGVMDEIFVIKAGSLGNLIVNTMTGAYEFDVDSLSLPAVPGVYSDEFIIRVSDSNMPAPQEQTLIYIISAVVNDTPIGLLPIFSHATTREIAGYWTLLVHEQATTPSITGGGAIVVPSTELMVIGQTETDEANPERDMDRALRQLFKDQSFSQTNEADTLINIKNNTQDVLDASDEAGVQARSFQVENQTYPDFVVEFTDVLSSQHKSFLLNRYRSNIGEAITVFYRDDEMEGLEISNNPNATNPIITDTDVARKIRQQINVLVDLGIQTIIGVMMNTGAVSDPAATQSEVLEMIDLITPSGVDILSVIPEYVASDDRYNNISKEQQVPQYTVPGFEPSYTLFTALNQVVVRKSDNGPNVPLRIVITDVTVNSDGSAIAIGEVLYGIFSPSFHLPGTPLPTLESSKVFSDNTNTISFEYALAQFSGSQIPLGATPAVTINQSSSQGQNVDQLEPGDVLYSSETYQRPLFMQLLVSVVSGVGTAGTMFTDIGGDSIYLQIDDGVRFPNNRVFPGVIRDALPIAKKLNSNTLEELSPPGDSIEFGFDYILNVNLPDNFIVAPDETFAAGGLERYAEFPRLGFVTLYFGSSSANAPIFEAYGRGAVLNISPVVPTDSQLGMLPYIPE